ncbi:unnamed protein product [Malus baccata var. baccata]
MGGGSMKSNPTKARKRVEATETEENSLSMSTAPPPSLVRGKDGSAFARCDECNKDVPVALITMHSCSLDAKIKLNLKAQVVERPPEVKKKPPTETQRKRFTTATSQPKMSKRAKKDKDPNAPKRPLTAFFLFLDDFRKSYKEANPDSKGVKTVYSVINFTAELKQEYKRALESDIAGDGDGGTADGVLEKEASEKEGEEEISDGDEDWRPTKSGMGPDKALKLKSRYCRAWKFRKVGGIGPVREFLAKPSWRRWRRWPRLGGMWPLKRLPLRERLWREDKRPRPEGMGPTRELSSRESWSTDNEYLQEIQVGKRRGEITLPPGLHSTPSQPPAQQSLPVHEDSICVVSLKILNLKLRREALSASEQTAGDDDDTEDVEHSRIDKNMSNDRLELEIRTHLHRHLHVRRRKRRTGILILGGGGGGLSQSIKNVNNDICI